MRLRGRVLGDVHVAGLEADDGLYPAVLANGELVPGETPDRLPVVVEDHNVLAMAAASDGNESRSDASWPRAAGAERRHATAPSLVSEVTPKSRAIGLSLDRTQCTLGGGEDEPAEIRNPEVRTLDARQGDWRRGLGRGVMRLRGYSGPNARLAWVWLSASVLGAATSHAGALGLLVGIDGDMSEYTDSWAPDPQPLTSHWIVFNGGAATPHEAKDGLLVRSGDGFARILVQRDCGVDEYGTEFCKDAIVVLDPTERFVRITGDAPETDDGDPPCAYEDLSINFAGAELISWNRRSGQSELCEPRGHRGSDSSWVRRLGNPQPMSFEELFGDAGAAAFIAAAEEAARNPPDPGFCSMRSGSDGQWLVHRRGTAWSALFIQEGNHPECPFFAEIPFDLGAWLGEPERSAEEWDSIVHLVPRARGAFYAPDNSVVLIDSLQTAVFALDNGTPSAEVLDLPSGSVVSLEWVTKAAEIERITELFGAIP